MDILFFLLPLGLIAVEYYFTKSRKRRDDAGTCGCI
jgi:hypothetical protein